MAGNHPACLYAEMQRVQQPVGSRQRKQRLNSSKPDALHEGLDRGSAQHMFDTSLTAAGLAAASVARDQS